MEFIQNNPLINEMKVSSALKMREIHLNKDVSEESVFEILYLINKLVKTDKIIGEKQPITIVIHSFGGCIYSGLALIGRIAELRDEGYIIKTKCTGVAMSMAAMILMVGSQRSCYRYSTIMIHQPLSSCFFTELKSLHENIDEVDRLWELLKTIIKENTLITEETLEESYKCKKDMYFDAEEALELGVVDKIL